MSPGILGKKIGMTQVFRPDGQVVPVTVMKAGPCVVMQNNAFNESRIHTVVVCALTSNLRRALVPGNVLLEEREADLAERSVINVSQLFTVDKEDLLEKIGTLPLKRVQQVFEGIYQLLKPEDYPL